MNTNVWSIILAGGEGERLRPVIRQWLGCDKPKQYCAFVGTRSMLQHTMDRADQITPPQQKLTIVARDHRRRGWPEHLKRKAGKIIVQPEDRGTAIAIFLALSYIKKRNPKAIVIVFPSDHFVHPEQRFLDVVHNAVCTAQAIRDSLVLLGVPARNPETDYGWIRRGSSLRGSGGYRLHTAASFVEKPSLEFCQQAMAAGALWNTLILACSIDFLWSLGRQRFPDTIRLLESFSPAIGTPEEEAELDRLYQELPFHNFSSDLLESMPHQIAVLELNGVIWSDWGRQERIEETLREIGKQPAFAVKPAAASLVRYVR
jgi:mannose-1-phosphate guanylyltransferase